MRGSAVNIAQSLGMRFRLLLIVVCEVLGCANARDVEMTVPDASPQLDAPPAPPDAGCVLTVDNTSQLLTNGGFDMPPLGTGWSVTPANPNFPVISATPQIPAHSPSAKAWMGNFEGTTDEIHQDFAVPASTTMLVVEGYYQLKTMEGPSLARDSGKVELVTTMGMVIETALALDNTQQDTMWTHFSHAFAPANVTSVAGQTVRFRITTSNNQVQPTSFLFDTLLLFAAHCP